MYINMEKYICNVCKYKTHKKSSMMNHIDSQKHVENIDNSTQKLQYIKMKDDYICLRCLKVYKHYQSLSRHNSLNCRATAHIKSFDDLLQFLQIDEITTMEENYVLDPSINIETINERIDNMMLRLCNLKQSLNELQEKCVATRMVESIKFYI